MTPKIIQSSGMFTRHDAANALNFFIKIELLQNALKKTISTHTHTKKRPPGNYVNTMITASVDSSHALECGRKLPGS